MVERYSAPNNEVWEDPDGVYVGYEEYAKSQQDRDDLAKRLEAAEAENAIYRDQIDSMQLAADNRVDQMTRIFAGYVMEKCKRKTLVVDPEELQHRFAHVRVVQSVAAGGKIRYQLLPVKDGK